MTFADVGDELAIEPCDRLAFEIDGPFAALLPHDDDNLVVRARDALLRKAKSEGIGFRLRLTKHLPLAAGIGGGSADAAAALRLLAHLLKIQPGDTRVTAIARSLGSDVMACLESRPVIGVGRGDSLEAIPAMPTLHCVMVNPGVAVPTAQAYRSFDTEPSTEGANRPELSAIAGTARQIASYLATCRNDLEASAIKLAPQIGEVLARLRHEPEVLLARMSGSGATCFALTENAGDARKLASRLILAHPDWWIRSAVLAGT